MTVCNLITDPALKEICNKILTLATHYSLIVRFVEQKYEFRFGTVNQALVAAMDEHLREYVVCVPTNNVILMQCDN
jgi:hypothetical protein